MSTDIRDNQNIQDPTQEGVEGLKGLGNSSSYYRNMESLDTFEDQESAKRLKSLLTANYTGHSENWVQDVGVVGLNDSMYDEDITNPKHLQNLTDARGEIQSGAAQLAAGLGKAVVTAGTTFAETANFIVSGSIWTLQEGYDAITGKDDSNHTFYNTVLNNSFAQALTDIQEASEEYMPNYRTDEENAADWWDNMFSAQGAANFWGDVIIKNLGFTVGALLSGGATTAALKSIGVASKAAHWMLGTAVGALGEASIEAKHNALDILDKGEQALDTSDFDYREQAIQNSETMTDEEKLITLSELQYNKNLAVQQARADMEKAAITTANSSFALNFAICWGTDLFTMGKILTRGSHGYNKQIQKTIKNASEAVGETVETTEDTIKKSKLSKFWNKVNENYEDEIAPVKYDKTSGKWISTINTKTQAAAKGVLKGLGEGLQEGLQKAAGETSSYYALSNDSPDWFRESEYADGAYQKGTGALKALVEGLKVFADPETYQEVFAGMFSMVGTPTFGRRQNSGSTTFLGRGKKIGLSGGILGEINDARELYNYYGDVADRMNGASFENIITHIGRMQIFDDKADEVLKNSDRNTKFEWLNQKENSLYSIAAAYSRAGRIKELNEMLDAVDVDNMTEEQIESYAQMAGAPPMSNDDNVNKQVRANTGFYDASGNLDIQGAKETIKDNITKTKAALESYTKNLEEIRYQLGRGRLSLDEEDELAWLKWKATEHSLRKDEILEKFTDILERCKDRKININNVEVDAVELFQKIANGNWKNKEDYNTEEEYNNSIDSLQEKSLEVMLKSLDKISEQLEEEGEAFDPDAVLQDFVDMIKLRNSNSLFLRKYMEYLNNPKKLQQKKFSKQKAHEAVNSLKERAKKQIDSKKEKEDIENNLDEVVKRIDSLDDQEKKAEALENLQEKYPEMFEKIEEFLELKARIVEAINNITGIEAIELGALNALFEKIASESDIKNPISLYNNFYKALEEGYNKSLSEGKAAPKGIKGSPFISTDTWKKAIESIQSIGDNANQNNNLKNQFNSLEFQGQESQESQESQKPESSTNQITLAQALSDNYVIAQLVNNITNFKSTSTRNPKVRSNLKIEASKTHNGKQYKAFRILYEDTSNPSNNIYMYALEESDGKLSVNIFLLPFFKNGKVEYEELTFSNITGYTSIYDKIEDLQSSILDIPVDENFEAAFKKSDYYRTLSMYSYQYKPFSYENGTKGKEEFLKTLNDRITALTEKLKDLYNFDTVNQTSSASLNLLEDQKKRLKKQIKEVKGDDDLPSVNSIIESFIREERLEDTEETKTALENFLTEGNVIVKDSEGHLERVSIDIIPDDDIDIYEDRDNLNSINVNNDTNPSTSSQFLDYWISPIRKLPIHYKNGETIPYHKTLTGEKALKERDEKLLKIHNVVWEFINNNNPQWTDIVKPDSEITFKVIKEVQDELKDQNVDETIVFMYVGDLPIGILKLDNDTGKTQEGLGEFKKAINEEFKNSGYSSSVQGKECFNSKYTTAVKTIGAGKTILNSSSTNYTNTKTLEELGIEIQDNIALMGRDKEPSINYPASAKNGQIFLKIKNKDTINQDGESRDTYNAIPVSSKTLREMYSSSDEVKEVVNYVVEELRKSENSEKVKNTLAFLNALFRARFKYSIVKVTDDSITLFNAKEQKNITIDKNSNTNDIITNIFRIFGISQFHFMPFLTRQFKKMKDEGNGITFSSATYYKIAQQAILTDASNNNLTTTDRFIAIEPISINNSVNTIFDVTEGTDEEIKNTSNDVSTTKDANGNSSSSSNTDVHNVNSESNSVDSLYSTDDANNSGDDDELFRQEFEEAEENEKVEKYNDDILQKEINWLAKVLPQFTNVERLHIVNKISAMGKKAWGMFKRGLIYIERTGAKGTVYHEAFHAVTDCLLTSQEYQVLLQEGRKKWTDENLSDLDIEEKLAEDFRVFVELMELAEEDMTPKQLEDYKRILAGVRGLKGEYGTGLTRLEAFYWNIHRGKFANRTLNENLNRGSKDALIEYNKEMNAIKQKAIKDGKIVLKEDGSFDYALAPNGNRSNLGLRQWLQVRTSAFRKWFGDWLNNLFAENVSIDDGSFNPDNVDAAGYRPEFIFRQNGKYVGSFHFEEYIITDIEGNVENNDTPYLTFPEVGNALSIEPEFRGKGLGKAMYYEAAKLAARKGKTLRSASLDSVSESAKRVWDSFVKSGYATVEDNHYIFNNDKLNFSKVVDENGEPLEVYHGSSVVGFTTFEIMKEAGIHFGTKEAARSRGLESVPESVRAFFLNIKKIDNHFQDNMWYGEKFINDYIKDGTITQEEGDKWIKEASDYVNEMTKDTYDYYGRESMLFNRYVNKKIQELKGSEYGIAYINETEDAGSTSYIVFNPNQIKSATDNVGLFDSDIDDTRYRLAVNSNTNGEQDYHQEIQDHYEQKWAYVNLTQEQRQVLESMGINPRMYDSLSLEEKEVLHQCRM